MLLSPPGGRRYLTTSPPSPSQQDTGLLPPRLPEEPPQLSRQLQPFPFPTQRAISPTHTPGVHLALTPAAPRPPRPGPRPLVPLTPPVSQSGLGREGRGEAPAAANRRERSGGAATNQRLSSSWVRRPLSVRPAESPGPACRRRCRRRSCRGSCCTLSLALPRSH